MKRELAVYLGPSGNEVIGDESWSHFSHYIPITEFVEVDFPDLDPKEYVPKQVEVLKITKDELQKKYWIDSAHIDDQISKLTSITHQPEEGS